MSRFGSKTFWNVEHDNMPVDRQARTNLRSAIVAYMSGHLLDELGLPDYDPNIHGRPGNPWWNRVSTSTVRLHGSRVKWPPQVV